MISFTNSTLSSAMYQASSNSLSRVRMLFYLVWPSETMFPSLELVPRYVTEMFPVFVMFALLENVVRYIQGKSTLRTNDTISSVSQGIFQECLRIKVRSIEVLVYCLVWDYLRLVTLPWNSLWTWWLCYISVDLGFYWAHRLAHEVNFIWAIHQAHHSSEQFSIVSALRQAVLQPFTAWFTYIPLALFIPPQIFLAHLQLSELYMAWLHTEVVDTVGPLEYILNTPSHHRVHHSRNPEYIDKNYGGMLIIWDRLFGTFKSEDKSNPPVYGLVHPVNRFEPFYVQFHTWPVIWSRIKEAGNMRDRLGVIFMGPGWRPGLKRLGDPGELPSIERPINCYNPPSSIWKNGYILIHFGVVLFFYHELTLHQSNIDSVIINVGILSLLISVTSLGLMLDDRSEYNCIFELARCSLFFKYKYQISQILQQGLSRLELSIAHQTFIMPALSKLFELSILIMFIKLIASFILTKTQTEKMKLIRNFVVENEGKNGKLM